MTDISLLLETGEPLLLEDDSGDLLLDYIVGPMYPVNPGQTNEPRYHTVKVNNILIMEAGRHTYKVTRQTYDLP
jgi:hypothetical protein